MDGKQPSTVKAYTIAIAQLGEFYRLAPDKLTEQQIRSYLVEKRKSLAVGSMRPIVSAIKFFYRVTVPRDWPTLRAVRLPKSRTVPVVLPPETCWRIIRQSQRLYLKAAMQLAFTCGLRSVDIRHLSPANIDSKTLSLNIKISKGNHQRRVPVPQCTVELLREAWKEHRNPHLMFPSRKNLRQLATTRQSVSARSLQRGMTGVIEQLRLAGRGIVFHTLRHSYATAMLDQGVNLKVLSGYLGHKNLQATEVYLHLTTQGDAKARKVVQQFFMPPDQDSSGAQSTESVEPDDQ